MKQIIKTILFLVHLLALLINKSTANFIKLYDKIHFYELKIDSFIYTQQYGTVIRGEGDCALQETEYHMPLLSSSGEQDDPSKKEYELKAQPLIYSNYEKTLSFLIKIGFKAWPSKYYAGYELVFQQDGKNPSCVQIVKNDDSIPFEFQLTIKDPSFLSHQNKNFTFYFGKIFIRALTSCQNTKSIRIKNNNLCAVSSTSTDSLEIGITSSAPDVDTSKITANLCSGHVMDQTCIMRYEPKYAGSKMFHDKNENFFIVLHPMPDEFERMNGSFTTFAESLPFPTDFISYRNQKLENGLVIKFLKYNHDSLFIMGMLKEPNRNNECLSSENIDQNRFCKCGNTCETCFDFPNVNQTLNYVALSRDFNPKYSRKCLDNKFLSAFDFENTLLASEFQKQDLSSLKQNFSIEKSRDKINNRDFLPRFCFEFKHGEAKGFYNIKMIFHDFHQVAQSTLIKESKYTINLYEYNYFIKNIHQQGNYAKKTIFKLKVNRILTKDSLNSQHLIEINNLKHSKYFLELIPKQKSDFCTGEDECIDESQANNQIQCVKCNRLLMKFDLQSKLVNDVKSIESKYKYSRENCDQIKPTISVRFLNQKHYKEISNGYKCSEDSSTFFNFIHGVSKNEPDEIFYKTKIYSTLIERNFNITNVGLPFDPSEPNDFIEFCDGMEFWEVVRNKFFISIASIFILVILLFVLVCLFTVRNILKYLYLFLTVDQQRKLSEFINKYTSLLNRKFKNFSIHVLDYTVDCHRRSELLEEADKIVYVCGTIEEVTKNLQNPFIIGQNRFHDEFNQIHCFRKYWLKSIDITFNQDVSIIDLSETDISSENSSLLNSDDSKQTCLEIGPQLFNESNSSSLIKSLSYTEPMRKSFYLKLPEQHKEFILFLLSSDKNDIFSSSKIYNSNQSNKHTIYRLALDYYISNFKRSLINLIKKEKSNVFYFDRNSSFDFYDFKVIDPDYDVLTPLSSLSTSSTQSVSDQSSKTTFDSNETSNETDQMEQKPLIQSRNYY